MIRAVFDTNVFLRGLLNPHSRCGCLLDQYADRYTLLTSPAIVGEVVEVLPKLRAKAPRLARLDLGQILALFERAEVIEPMEVPRVCRDPNDDMFIACAIGGGARFLVTEDLDLLDLHEHQGIEICRAERFLRVLEES